MQNASYRSVSTVAWTDGVRSLISVDSEVNVFPLKNLGVPHMLLDTGAETRQVICLVASVMEFGVTETVAHLDVESRQNLVGCFDRFGLGTTWHDDRPAGLIGRIINRMLDDRCPREFDRSPEEQQHNWQRQREFDDGRSATEPWRLLLLVLGERHTILLSKKCR